MEKRPDVSHERKKDSRESVAEGGVLRMVSESVQDLIIDVERGRSVSLETLQLVQAQLEYAREQVAKREQALEEAERTAHEHREEATKDSLTHLFNRRGFMEALSMKIERTKESPTDLLYAFFIDLDKFKFVNDTYGHEMGDRYLTIVTAHLHKALRPDDTLARFGGDEFTALCFVRYKGEQAEESHDVGASHIALRIQYALDAARQELNEEIKRIFPDAPLAHDVGSVGYAFYDPTESVDAAAFIRQADRRMYEQKQKDSADKR
ncbi:MAG: hypothetical protein B7X04_01360 [Parcubacteria group bacterium 21-54-25]|nr:MAG: hypothetical protein B7X04_01360 [Parcubacteria group bacterium 21-54-25]HQU07579.1 GGDEF domain-containing protein [Candidatus Paceibacterota bacterium]